MQVERTAEGQLEAVSGGRVSNTWVTHLGARDNGSKGPLIPGTLLGAQSPGEERGRQRARPQTGPRPISWLAG